MTLKASGKRTDNKEAKGLEAALPILKSDLNCLEQLENLPRSFGGCAEEL